MSVVVEFPRWSFRSPTAREVADRIGRMDAFEMQKLASMVFRAQRDWPHRTYDQAERGAILAGLEGAALQEAED